MGFEVVVGLGLAGLAWNLLKGSISHEDKFDETGECEKFSITPKNGMLLMWPGILSHEVPRTDTKRILVAANLITFYPVGDPPYGDGTKFPLNPSIRDVSFK